MVARMAQTLLIVATAPVIQTGTRLRLDTKFVEGMRLHAAQWPGPVRCLLRRGGGAIPFGADHDPATLGFELALLDEGAPFAPNHLNDVRAVFAAADDVAALALMPLARAAGAVVVWSLEYTLETRLRIAAMDPARSLPRRAWSMLWNGRMERHRRAALRGADGVQFNGWPAWDVYRAISPRPMLYLDNRMTRAMMASPQDMADRATRLLRGDPLRLIHSGRLEPMKGAQDLLAVMAALRDLDVPATLDIYGTGSLEGQIRTGLAAFGRAVRLHGPVDFETELVPVSRTEADVFLSCHRQSDPSCTYLEAMGCGLALAGYANRMLARLVDQAGSGAVSPMGHPAALAQALARWHHDREAVMSAQATALAFARKHDFETEFTARMDHLKAIALR
jgi:colanic acid/amylovoran biosynthesis glycosyltransferase